MSSIRNAILLYISLIFAALLMIFPIVYTFLISFMSGAEVLQGNLFPNEWTLENYKIAFSKVPLLRYLWNSFFVSFVVMIVQLLVSSLAAFAFVFLSFRGRSILFYIFIATMMVPWEATIIPNFLTIQRLGWIDSYLGLTVPFFAMAFGTFLLRQHFKTIPKELFEASQVAGISHFRFFLNVVLPVSKTNLVTLGIYTFLTTWNMYFWPLLITNTEEMRTVQIGLKQMQSQELSTEWGVVMAATVVIILPTLMLLFLGQKQLQKGLMQGVIK
jgi:sn-glycerol 3-phosphate transport system permease protein